jgi:hypothetical protein
MSIHLERSDLINTQQMEVAVRGPDGATHLILCTGIVCLDPSLNETYTFFVGPKLSRRQFVGVIASGALSTIQTHHKASIENDDKVELGADLISINANYDDKASQVKVGAEVSSTINTTKLSISYSVNILAELPMY